MQNIDKIKEKVQKLLNQAADREGTPEGESFYAKAFGLMATYGFDERDLGSPDSGDEVIHREYGFPGSYSDMQAVLLLGIGRALHCKGFYHRVRNSTRAAGATLFGLRRHVERVDMLYSLLLPVMLVGARRQPSSVVKRRSYMTGFAASIEDRLRSAEQTVASTNARYELALLDDAALAEDALDSFAEANNLFLSNSVRSRSFDPGAYLAGHDDGSMTDLGQTRVKARPALPF